MPRKLRAVAQPGGLPPYIKESRVYQKRTVTKRKLPSFTEAMLLLHAPEALRRYWDALLEGLEKRDKSALDAVGEIFNYVRGKGVNVSVSQQILQQNTVAGADSPVMGFDAFTRHLAEVRAGHALPPPEVIDLQPEG